MTDLMDEAYAIYTARPKSIDEPSGQFAVYAWAEKFHPELAWAWCEPCEDHTPTIDDSCAVCATVRGD